MEENPCIGYEIKALDNLIRRKMEGYVRGSELRDVTRMHAWIIGFLYRNQDKDMFQRDVEAEFSITRSTATNILQLMVKKGYITRIPVDYDDRLKKLVLSDEAIRIHKMAMNNIDAMERSLAECITEKEYSEFMRILLKIKASLET